jgi:hypothetical protein
MLTSTSISCASFPSLELEAIEFSFLVLETIAMADSYTYSPIDSAGGEIRLLTVRYDTKQMFGHSNIDPLVGSMKSYRLPIGDLSRGRRLLKTVQIPTFFAISYVWGNPKRAHEITIDGKKLGITENLHGALRDSQRDPMSLGHFNVWADAICINQDDLAERSAQVFLMRDIYHYSAEVRVWLGVSTEEGRRCLQFISGLTGGIGYNENPAPGDEEMSRGEELAIKAIVKPSFAVLKAGYGFAQLLEQTLDALDPKLDSKASIFSDPDGELSLHRERVEEFAEWRPSKRALKKVEGQDLREIASLIDEHLIQRCQWFERMWVVQEVCLFLRIIPLSFFLLLSLLLLFEIKGLWI